MQHIKKTHLLLFLLFLMTASAQLSALLYRQASAAGLARIRPESDKFRTQTLSEQTLPLLKQLEQEASMPAGEILSVLASGQDCRFARLPARLSAAALWRWRRVFTDYRPAAYGRVRAAYGAVWDDIACFPVDAQGVSFENSWMFERTYGGTRGHEGTDLMPPEDIPGCYRIVSMTDGVVEHIGWLPQGGWRIGVRSPSGGYFYYAHLDSYAADFSVGEYVSAGQLLGFMGDTGYGDEGTRGRFPVHLHLGIYIRTETTPELSVNPYWVLRYCRYRTAGDAASE